MSSWVPSAWYRATALSPADAPDGDSVALQHWGVNPKEGRQPFRTHPRMIALGRDGCKLLWEIMSARITSGGVGFASDSFPKDAIRELKALRDAASVKQVIPNTDQLRRFLRRNRLADGLF